MESKFQKKERDHFDVAAGWPSMALDCLLAAVFSEEFIGESRSSHIVLDQLEDGSSLLLIGSYWSLESVIAASKKCSEIGYYPMSESDASKYNHDEISNLYIVSYIDSLEALQKHEWAKFIVRRDKHAAIAGDNEIYRGMCMDLSESGNDSFYPFFCDILDYTEPFTKAMVDVWKKKGKYCCSVNKMNATNLVKDNSVLLESHGYSICAVQGPITPVMETTVAASKLANIGLNVRYDHKKCKTYISFITQDPTRVSLDFLKEMFSNLGGRDHSRGGTLDGIRMFPTKNLDELHIIIHEKRVPPS